MKRLALICFGICLLVAAGCSRSTDGAKKDTSGNPAAQNKLTPEQKRQAEAFWIAAETGGLYETHTFPGKPDIQIQIRGFVDSDFDAYLCEGKTRKKITTSLAVLREEVGNSTNPNAKKYEGACKTTKGRPQIFEVFWSANGNRVGIAFCGYLVAGYDSKSARAIDLESYQRAWIYRTNKPTNQTSYQACDSDIATFLAED